MNRSFEFNLLWVCCILLLSACTGAHRHVSIPQETTTHGPLPPDYSNLTYWAAHPAKYDLSDSLPAPYKPQVTDTTVDVFFLHPTSYLAEKAVNADRIDDSTERYRWNADVNDPAINRVTDEGSMLNQASVFNRYRVFAPRYRQAHIRAFYLPDTVSAPFFDTAYADVKAAFTWYLQHENNGRPFIIAAHSQGTLHAGRLLKDMVEDSPLQQQLVVAYLVGLPVPDHFFSQLKPCTRPDGTGCFASWRTYKKGFEPAFVQQEKFRAVVVNPLSWTTDSLWVSRQANKGAVLYKFNKPKPANVGAGIHGNVLWSSKPRFFGNIFFTRKNYHIGDINLFWGNIRDNVQERVEAYGNKRILE